MSTTRRGFLASVAALPFVPYFGIGKPPKAKQAPLPRWEWARGPWYLQERQEVVRIDGFSVTVYSCQCLWYGSGVVSTHERDWWKMFCDSDRACNETVFCQVPIGHLVVVSQDFCGTGSGHADCKVVLRESKKRLDGMVSVDPRGKQRQFLQVYKRANFYNLFHGTHAVSPYIKLA